MTMQFSSDFIRASSIIAAPFTDDYRFHRDTDPAIAEACSSHGYVLGYTIPLFDYCTWCYKIRFVVGSFGALNDVDVMPVEFLLLDQERRFAIIAADDFNTIAGPRAFVERAIEMTVEDAWKAFNKEYIEHEGYSSALRDGWRELVKYYHTTK